MCDNGGHRAISWDDTNKGAPWNISITGPELWFPASGYRRFNSGMLTNVGGTGYLWPASAFGATNARHMSFYYNDWGWNQNVRSFGFPVRAVAEEVAVD
jgi:hypothetical protein